MEKENRISLTSGLKQARMMMLSGHGERGPLQFADLEISENLEKSLTEKMERLGGKWASTGLNSSGETPCIRSGSVAWSVEPSQPLCVLVLSVPPFYRRIEIRQLLVSLGCRVMGPFRLKDITDSSFLEAAVSEQVDLVLMVEGREMESFKATAAIAEILRTVQNASGKRSEVILSGRESSRNAVQKTFGGGQRVTWSGSLTRLADQLRQRVLDKIRESFFPRAESWPASLGEPVLYYEGFEPLLPHIQAKYGNRDMLVICLRESVVSLHTLEREGDRVRRVVKSVRDLLEMLWSDLSSFLPSDFPGDSIRKEIINRLFGAAETEIGRPFFSIWFSLLVRGLFLCEREVEMESPKSEGGQLFPFESDRTGRRCGEYTVILSGIQVFPDGDVLHSEFGANINRKGTFHLYTDPGEFLVHGASLLSSGSQMHPILKKVSALEKKGVVVIPSGKYVVGRTAVTMSMKDEGTIRSERLLWGELYSFYLPRSVMVELTPAFGVDIGRGIRGEWREIVDESSLLVVDLREKNG